MLKCYLVCVSNHIWVEASSTQEAQNQAIAQAKNQNYWLAEILEGEEDEVSQSYHHNGEYIETDPFCLPVVGADSDYRTHNPSEE